MPGMIAAMLEMNFVNTCIGLEIEGETVSCVREIDGGKESLKTRLPLIIGGQKGLVEESDLRIPNMRGIMMARKKSLTVMPPVPMEPGTRDTSFEKPAPKGRTSIRSSTSFTKKLKSFKG